MYFNQGFEPKTGTKRVTVRSPEFNKTNISHNLWVILIKIYICDNLSQETLHKKKIERKSRCERAGKFESGALVFGGSTHLRQFLSNAFLCNVYVRFNLQHHPSSVDFCWTRSSCNFTPSCIISQLSCAISDSTSIFGAIFEG